MTTPDATEATPHSLFDDLNGLVTGTFVASLGIFLLKSGEVVTGGIAGISLLVSYLVDLPFGVIFMTINTPFFGLALWKKGWNFTLRTAFSVALVSALTQVHLTAFGDLRLPIVYAAIGGNLLAGVGMLILFRHHASLGGLNVIALLAQEKFGWRAGYVQMAMDASIVIGSIVAVAPLNILVSALGAVVINLVLALNHRPGRYIGH